MESGTTRDHNIERIAKGREAAIMAGLLKPLIDRKISEHLIALVTRYRSGDITHDGLVGGIAAISAFMGILSELETIQKQGIAAHAHEVNNAKTTS